MKATPTPSASQAFATAALFRAWLKQHHATSPEIWLRLSKKGSSIPSVTYAEALDACEKEAMTVPNRAQRSTAFRDAALVASRSTRA